MEYAKQTSIDNKKPTTSSLPDLQQYHEAKEQAFLDSITRPADGNELATESSISVQAQAQEMQLSNTNSYRPEDLDLIRARSLGYPTEETRPGQSPTSSLSYQDLEKGIGADLIQHQLGANHVEESDDPPTRGASGHPARPFKKPQWRISAPPSNLPQLPSKRSRYVRRRGTSYSLCTRDSLASPLLPISP